MYGTTGGTLLGKTRTDKISCLGLCSKQCVILLGGKVMYFSFRTNFIFIYRFRPSSVFCSFFYSTGWAVKNDERVVLFKLLLFKLVITRKSKLLTYHKNIVLRVFVGFGINILKIYSYTFTFEIFGYSGFFLLVVK